MPEIPDYATNNAHMFYLVFPSLDIRSTFIAYLKKHNIQAVFHYLSLHTSKYYVDKHDGRILPQCDRYADCLMRLPLFFDLDLDTVEVVCKCIAALLEK